jgi:hypothetical protein
VCVQIGGMEGGGGLPSYAFTLCSAHQVLFMWLFDVMLSFDDTSLYISFHGKLTQPFYFIGNKRTSLC